MRYYQTNKKDWIESSQINQLSYPWTQNFYDRLERVVGSQLLTQMSMNLNSPLYWGVCGITYKYLQRL